MMIAAYPDSLAGILRTVHDNYIQRNPTSRALHEEKLSYMPGANTRTTLHFQPYPLTFARGESAKLFDVDGHEYIDFLGEYSAGVYGHSRPEIKKAIADAMDKGWNFGGSNQYEVQLAQALVSRFDSIDLIRFCNSGTEANLMAIAAALNFTGKKKILVFLNGYHGGTLTFLEAKPKYSANAIYDFIIAPYNDIPRTDAMVAELAADSLAAILVEPMQVSGGCIPGSLEFLQYLRELATKHEAILIFDEIMTSRLDYGGFQSKLNIKPDMTTIGKWAGGGMSFGAFGGRREIMDMFDPRRRMIAHAGTFNNNIITMAAGIAGCSLMDKNNVKKLNSLGDKLRKQIGETITSRLSDVGKGTPKMFTIGLGSLFAVRFNGPDSEILQGLFFHHLLERGIYIASRGFFALTLETKEEHFEPLLRAVGQFLDEYKSALI